MGLQVLPGFRCRPTDHCVTGSLRHIYEFNGYPVSEDLLLGLGAGVGFVYWHMKGTLPFLGGRANVGRPGEEGLEKTAGRRTGVQVESYRTASARKAESALVARLSAGEPVMVQVDMGFLPYFKLPKDYHFGGHVVVVAGYDAEAGSVLLADRDGVLYPVALAVLAQARGSQFKPFPPGNTWYAFDFGGRRAPTVAEVLTAIREVTRGMLEPPIANLGVKGIRKAADLVPQWPGILGEEELRSACFNGFIFIDATGGTGGGIFRYMYGRFLQEAASITGDRRLADLGTEMSSIGDHWQQVAVAFRQAHREADPAPRLREVSDLLRAIADREQGAWEKLDAIVTEEGEHWNDD